jgi:hypothetical protein
MDLVFIATPKDENNKLDCSFLIVLTTKHEEIAFFKAGKVPTYSGASMMQAYASTLKVKRSSKGY